MRSRLLPFFSVSHQCLLMLLRPSLLSIFPCLLVSRSPQLITLDFFLIEKRYTRPMSTLGATALSLSVGSAYSLWIEHCATINGQFPYPFLNLMNVSQRVEMYTGSTIGALLTFWGLNAMHR